MDTPGTVLMDTMAAITALAGLVIAAWWAVGLFWMHTRVAGGRSPHVSLPADLHGAPDGVSLAFMVFYIFTALSLVGYLLYIWRNAAAY